MKSSPYEFSALILSEDFDIHHPGELTDYGIWVCLLHFTFRIKLCHSKKLMIHIFLNVLWGCEFSVIQEFHRKNFVEIYCLVAAYCLVKEFSFLPVEFELWNVIAVEKKHFTYRVLKDFKLVSYLCFVSGIIYYVYVNESCRLLTGEPFSSNQPLYLNF